MAGVYNFPKIYERDTFRGRTITIKIDGNPIDLSNADINLMIIMGNGQVVRKMPTRLGANTGEIVIESWDIDIESYKYNYQLQIRLENDITLTYMVGCFEVLNSFDI